MNVLNLFKLQSVLSIETASSEQKVYAALNKALEHDLVIDEGFLVGKSTYRKARDVPFTIHGPIGMDRLPVVTEVTVYAKDNRTVVELHSSLARAVIGNKLLLFFFISLCLIIIMAVIVLHIPFLRILLAPLAFWLFGMLFVSSGARATKKALETALSRA